MSRADPTLPAAASPAVSPAARASHVPALALCLGTLFWGVGFTWAKEAGDRVNVLFGRASGAPLGPLWLLAARFWAGLLLCLVVAPAARRGWSWPAVKRAAAVGAALAAGLVAQHLGLDRTSEAVSAFLTSLTIVFVPLLLTAVRRRPPRPIVWAGVALATAGVWLMTGATPAGFGAGELLGLACAGVYSVYILLVDDLVPKDDAWRMTAGQFAVVAMLTTLAAGLSPGGAGALRPAAAARVLADPLVAIDGVLLTIFTTFGAFAILTRFQPRVDPTRAAFVYLCEPIFASAYAWLARGHALPAAGLVGAGLILLANGLLEFLAAREGRGGSES